MLLKDFLSMYVGNPILTIEIMNQDFIMYRINIEQALERFGDARLVSWDDHCGRTRFNVIES